VLRDCPLAGNVWNALVKPGEKDYFFAGELIPWLINNLL